ncbi:maestro heat-like repeat-containing protein family member 1 [Phlebotomus argentipes]|uniref:maestro heat-like repeat-containing protein family member 1 n=1 Tax=Phlebotomus argentipes TaxID=94469 RepID=UPI0028933148|nr:maestro heat-like repeat-containing protein family member 1 [Phlebotomus argentipes]
MEANSEGRNRIKGYTSLVGSINNLLESLDKDESVRNAIESSIIRIADYSPNEVLQSIHDFRQKQAKLSEANVATILRIVEHVTCTKRAQQCLTEVTVQRISEMCIVELVKMPDMCPAVQKPALESLVALGRRNCDVVMENLMRQMQHGQVTHFMVLHSMGQLATANPMGIVNFLKHIFRILLPTLDTVKQDHVKQAHAFAIGRFCEAIAESHIDESLPSEPADMKDEFAVEIGIAYEVLLNNWLMTREPKVCADILVALSHMFPLMAQDKIVEQLQKVIPAVVNLYRRSLDRISITQFLAAILKASTSQSSDLLNPVAYSLCVSLFDLICVNPNYEKPQTVKGHNEVLRCFDLLAQNYSHHILDMLLIQLQSNNERERIKALLVLTHLTNTKDALVSTKNREFCDILKQMIANEKTVRMKLVLLKTIIAFIQKSFTKEKIFIRFIVRHCCPYSKFPSEQGSAEEFAEFVQICNNSLFILSTTIGTIDDVLKRELLSYFMLQDYTSACGTLAKSLASLFSKDPQLQKEEEIADINTEDLSLKTSIPKAESVFVRCLALIGEGEDVKRAQNILLFLKSYATIVNKHLPMLWNEKIPELQAVLQRNGKFQDFGESVLQFVAATIKDVDDVNFPVMLIDELKEQLPLYTVNPSQVLEFKIPSLQSERGTILRVLATCLCHILDEPVAEGIVDLIVNAAKQEKLDKSLQEGEMNALTSAAKALGIISRTYLQQVLKKLDTLIQEEGRKRQTSGFFSTLNFMKESQKESDIFKVKLLVVESYGYIVTNCPPECFLQDVEKTIVSCLYVELQDAKDAYLKNRILDTLLSICQHVLNNDANHKLKLRNELVQQILKIPIDGADNLPFLPKILRLGTALIRIQSEVEVEESEEIHFLETICENFFTCAQKLKSKFESPEEDDRNSYLAKYLNESLPELNEFVRAILEQNPSPACLDDVVSILERWSRDKNCEVRICAGHVTNGVLEVYMKTMKMGCEAPSKFNQTGHMIGKTVPRCIDSNATVRQISVDVLRKILEISHIYETLTLPDVDIQWVKDLIKVRSEIITDDPNEIYKLASEMARIVADRLPSFQHMALSRSLLMSLSDPEKSSAIGASVVLKFFMQLKGSEMFHAITTLINECLQAIWQCEVDGVKIGVLKAIVALAKHHPKLVCAEMLAQSLPFDANVAQFWRTLCTDQELAGTVIDNFLATLSSSCLYEPVDQSKKDDRNKIATVQPFAIICALKEILPCVEIQNDLKKRFPELFGMLLTTLATYTGVLAPNAPNSSPAGKNNTNSKASKFGFIPNKDSIKSNPCEIVLLTFKEFLRNLGMEQVSVVFDVCPHLASSEDLGHFIDVVPPIANALVNELGISSTAMRQVVTVLSKYIPSPYDPQRIAAIALYSQLVPHKPSGEIVSVIILHLNSSLNDPNPLVRGCCLRGLGFVASLATFDAEKYSEMTLTALMKGLDDANSSELMNIPLESIQGLSRIMVAMPCKKIEMFQISLAIRIRPFFENSTLELRNSAIGLFGDVCQSKLNAIEGKGASVDEQMSIEPFREQLYYNFCPLLLHLCESEPSIARTSKVTLKKMCALLKAAPKINSMAQSHLLEHGQLNYEVFIEDFVKVIGEELADNMADFIESCLPHFKSQWPEVRGNAAILVGLLHQYNTTNQPNIELITQKISALLKDESVGVKIKASTALGYLFAGQ